MPSRYAFDKNHPDPGQVRTVADLLTQIEEWAKGLGGAEGGHGTRASVWYRGHDDVGYDLAPGVHRGSFDVATGAASPNEQQRLAAEREMIREFRQVGAPHFDPLATDADLYFAAQHHGLPTRLLDWTTNPLAALFFACCKKGGERDGANGEVFVTLAKDFTRHSHPDDDPTVPRYVMSVRDAFISDAVAPLFWHEPREKRPPLVLPFRPDHRLARIARQSGCFTFHTLDSKPLDKKHFKRFLVPREYKPPIMRQLRTMNVNWYSVYQDLDNLAKEVRSSFGIA